MQTLRLTPFLVSEEEEQMTLFDLIRQKEHLYPDLKRAFHVPNGGYRGQKEGRKMVAMGVRRGVPDLLLPVPVGGALGLAIELKARDASPSDTRKEQRDWLDFLAEQGWKTDICYGWVDAWNRICDYLSLPRKERE